MSPAKEHWVDFKKKKEDSHIQKHQILHHDSEEPKFIMKIIGFHRSALSRQVGEAVRIMKRASVLNSKSEYSRCKITRLSLENSSEEQEVEKGEKVDHTDWTTGLLERRLGRDKLDRQSLDGLKMTDSSKRKNDHTKTGRKPKRRKYEIISEDWGLGSGERALSSGIEGVKSKPNCGPVVFNTL